MGRMRFDAWCSYKPYIDHLVPIWSALPDERRGTIYVPAHQLDYAWKRGLDVRTQDEYVDRGHTFLVFSRAEYRAVLPKGPIVFIEHGVGPAYGNRSHLLYSVCSMPPILGVLTTPANAPTHRSLLGPAYVHEVGCPKLDVWHDYKHKRDGRCKPVVAFSHHWDERSYPEARSAWPWDKEAWESLAKSKRYHILGHKHPGDSRDIEAWCTEAGIEFTSDFEDVMRRADLYVCDNSSTLYEFTYTDRPVVVLSPPFYRRDADHGLRFWKGVPGVECALPDHLEACIQEALTDVPARAALRRAAVETAYGQLDGHATQRAIDALEWIAESGIAPKTLGEPPAPPPLTYPVPLAKTVEPFEFAGRTWKAGDRIDHDTAVAMKAAGFLTDSRIV